jgi:hypothetical protein
MRSILFLTFLFMTSFLSAQENEDFLIHKSFTAHVGSICEETAKPDPCAGKQIYLVLAFKKEQVSISEKYVNSCGKESIRELGNYNWELVASTQVKIDIDPEQKAYTYMENLTLVLKAGQLVGKRKNWETDTTEYIFVDHSKQK